MPILSDETCPPATIIITEEKPHTIVTNDARSGVEVADDGNTPGITVASEFTNEDCPGAHNGDGCE